MVLIEIAKLTAATVSNGAGIRAYTGLTVGGQDRITCTAASSVIGIQDEALRAAADEAVDREGFVK